MADVLLGLAAVPIGLLLAFRGWVLLRTAIPVWGLFAGFFLGAGLVTYLAGDGFLATVLGWVVGVAVAIGFAAIAYFYYEVSVVLAFASIGFSVATTLMVALGLTWNWLIALIGIAAALVLAFFAIVGNMPKMLLVVFGATAGATITVAGLMLIFGVMDIADLSVGGTTQRIDEDWWWWLVYIAIAIMGIIAQIRVLNAVTASLREQWVAAGGRELAHPDAAPATP